MRLLLFQVIAAAILMSCNGYSTSMSCIMTNGQRVCKQNADPNGNSASSGAMTDGNNGQMFTNAGRQPYPMYPNSGGSFPNLGALMRTVMGQVSPYANRQTYPMNSDYYNYF